MSIRELQEYTRISKYARYNKDKQRRETWDEQINRVIDMHKEFYADKLYLIKEEIDEIEYALKKKLILGSQRALQFGGKAILSKHGRLYNCTASYCDRVKFFQEAMWLMLCGCGVGFSVQKHHIEKLPKIKEVNKEDIVKIKIKDSIEGWSDAVGQLLSSYFINDVPFPELKGKNVKFDYSLIRPKGSIIKSSGCKAPGPEGLEKAIEEIRDHLDSIIVVGYEKLRPIDAYDIIMHESDAVISGGVRRAACLSLFSLDDDEMMKAKIGDWHTKNPQRARSNNSVLLLRDSVTIEQFEEIIKNVKEYGEPGFIFADDKEFLINPCLTADSLISTDQGIIPFEKLIKNYKDYKILSYNEENKTLEYEKIINAKQTRKNADIIKLDFDDGTFLKLTPDHKVYTKNRGYVKASQLTENDEILSI